MKINYYLLTKMTFGFIIGFLIAEAFSLDYVYTAGVIAVLSLEPTRKRSIEIGIIRIIDSLIALSLAYLIFYFMGFSIWSLFVFIIIFIPLSYLIKMDRGIVVSLVLVSQVYLEQDVNYALNALFILLIGIGVAFLLNLYMPDLKKKIKLIVNRINKSIEEIILSIAAKKDISFDELDYLISSANNNIREELENNNIDGLIERLRYVEMRKEQTLILKRINNTLINVSDIKEKTLVLNYLKEFKGQIGDDNYALQLTNKLNQLLDYFKTSDLPDTRKNFEDRAQLYYVLLEIHQFLQLKLNYHERQKHEAK
ncbi:MAG: aromatic acid exporter family protein [Acholeplasmataceae bacterium]|jgi:uncharacterized membrane protein YgaE (UPF0421/DUF939 family)|nr:aromatic acid exporter family protein [Acholeplasmataceae bacterium]